MSKETKKERQLNEIKQNSVDLIALIDEAYELGFKEGGEEINKQWEEEMQIIVNFLDVIEDDEAIKIKNYIKANLIA